MASSTPLVSGWHPDITYDFILKIGGEDRSTDLTKVEIRSTISAPYSHIFLDVLMDPHDLLLFDMFGQQLIKLSIILKGKVPEDLEQVNFFLMYIDTDTEYRTGQANYQPDQVERNKVRLKTVPIGAYRTMSTLMNKIYFNQKPYDIIMDMASSMGNDIEYDISGRSNLAIDQLLIPPTTFYNVVKYLDRTYGVFHGPMAFHVTYDNKIILQNLNTIPNRAQEITLHLLATDTDMNNTLSASDPKVFYTTSPVVSSYKGNAVFGVEAPTVKYIVKPRDSLSNTINVDLESFTSTYGVIEKNNPKIYYNKEGINTALRVGYEKDQTGYDNDRTFVTSNLSQNIADMATVIATVSGNLPTLNLLVIGEHVKIVSHSDDHLKLGGAYILKGSDIQFAKSTTWESMARLYMTRSNVASQ